MEIQNHTVNSLLDLRSMAWDIGESAGVESVFPPSSRSGTLQEPSENTKYETFCRPSDDPFLPIAQSIFEAKNK